MTCEIIYLIGQLSSGGSERQLYYLLKAMDRRYQPQVVVWNFCEHDAYVSRIRALGVPIHSFPNGMSRMTKLFRFRRKVKQLQPGVVHSYSSHTNFAAWWSTLGSKTIPIGSVRGDYVQEKNGSNRWLSEINFRWPRKQIYNSYAALERARASKSPFVPCQIKVISNGVDLQSFPMVPLITNGRINIAGVGSLLLGKQWNRLVMAAVALKRRAFVFRIVIAGDGPLRLHLEQEAKDLGVADCVSFIGYCEDIPKLLREANFLVHTSDSEGCPNVIMEAMASGRAVIATNVGDVPRLVDDGTTGFIVPRDSSTLLIERMAMLISDRELCSMMGKAGRARAEREFGLNRVVSETLELYRAAGWRPSVFRGADI